jgi:hypothetical protein
MKRFLSTGTHTQFKHIKEPILKNALSLGIRREDKNRWERRVPLIPEHVERLVKEMGVRVLVQPSLKRVIPDEKYAEVSIFMLFFTRILILCLNRLGLPSQRTYRLLI